MKHRALRIGAICLTLILLVACAKPLEENDGSIALPTLTQDPAEDVFALLNRIDVWAFKPEAHIQEINAIAARPGSLVVFAGGTLFWFDISQEMRVVLKDSLDLPHYISAMAIADVTGEGRDGLLVAGALTTDWSDGCQGYIGVYAFEDGRLVLTNEIVYGEWPYMSVSTLDYLGDGRPEILVGAWDAMFAFSTSLPETLLGVHPEFAGAFSSTGKVMAWRNAEGTAGGVFVLNEQEFEPLWEQQYVERTFSGVPAIGFLGEDEGFQYLFSHPSGLLSVFDSTGDALSIPQAVLEQLDAGCSLASAQLTDINGNGALELILPQAAGIYIYRWPN